MVRNECVRGGEVEAKKGDESGRKQKWHEQERGERGTDMSGETGGGGRILGRSPRVTVAG